MSYELKKITCPWWNYEGMHLRENRDAICWRHFSSQKLQRKKNGLPTRLAIMLSNPVYKLQISIQEYATVNKSIPKRDGVKKERSMPRMPNDVPSNPRYGSKKLKIDVPDKTFVISM